MMSIEWIPGLSSDASLLPHVNTGIQLQKQLMTLQLYHLLQKDIARPLQKTEQLN